MVDNTAPDAPKHAAPPKASSTEAPPNSAPPAPGAEPPAPGSARWNLVLSRACLPAMAVCEDDAVEDVELLASNLCAALSLEMESAWLLCEVFTAQGNVEPRALFAAKFQEAGHAVEEEDVPALKLKLGVTPDRACYGCMRPPRGHCCTRCLDVPIARVLRKGVESTFAPGIGLVGRCWETKKAEVLDLAVARCFPAAYVRTAAWDVGHLRTVVAVPISRKMVGTGKGTVSDAFAVVLIYFGAALLRDRADGEMQRGLGAAMARAAKAANKRQHSKALRRAALQTPPPSPPSLSPSPSTPALPLSFGWSPPPAATPTLTTALGPPVEPRSPSRRDVSRVTNSKLEDSAADVAAAAKFDDAFGGRPAAQDDMGHLFSAHSCAICFSTMKHAFTIDSCGHTACRDCLARWTALSAFCPSCRGHIDGVGACSLLDEEIATAKHAAQLHRRGANRGANPPPALPNVLGTLGNAKAPPEHSPTCVIKGLIEKAAG
ncbi:hypothetical protein M885DRAFT_547521 [Pelagophyceae sp. CCMP2097]|nr:hypothetical protein M885DRAFT_547521 [Pelagophyceae sp. CCMP2097]|mmetsp:Transcript_2911/g.8670  ORF Transcript_2911/g.8670 Transcript_2911/m.8670 type:complete len:490 (-) Transcript_2911:220-1689(-)